MREDVEIIALKHVFFHKGTAANYKHQSNDQLHLVANTLYLLNGEQILVKLKKPEQSSPAFGERRSVGVGQESMRFKVLTVCKTVLMNRHFLDTNEQLNEIYCKME